MLIDGHAHLNEIENVEDAIQEARTAGVAAIIGVGMTIDSNERILGLAREYPGYIYPAIGYHPWEIRPETVESTVAFITEHLAVAIGLGEVGLDYKAKVKKPLQWRVLSRLLEMAVRHEKPAILHCRFSHDRTLALVLESGLERAVFHWYTGSVDTLKRILDCGFLISATPALVYSQPHQEAVRCAPLERILLETDSPVDYEGKPSRPADVRRTAGLVAEIKGIPFEEVIQKTTGNANRFFGLSIRT